MDYESTALTAELRARVFYYANTVSANTRSEHKIGEGVVVTEWRFGDFGFFNSGFYLWDGVVGGAVVGDCRAGGGGGVSGGRYAQTTAGLNFKQGVGPVRRPLSPSESHPAH